MKERTNNLLNEFYLRYPNLEYLKSPINKSINELVECYKNGRKILVCGNGGSCADSEHIAGELLKSFMLKRKIDVELEKKLKDSYSEEGEYIANNLQQGIKCIPLTSFSALNTAFANDCDEKMTFAQLTNVFGNNGDILIGISTSGNSKNVVYAAKVARVKNMKVIALTGESGGKLKDIADILLNVPSTETFKIQEYHLPIYHILCACIESEIFEK